MMRLIDADALEADLQKQFDKVFTEAGRKVKPEDYFIERHAVWFANVVKAENDSFFDYLKTRPTIDAVPVVRCKDCVGYIPWIDGKICARFGSYFGNTKPNDFCSHGARRSDNE